MRRTFRFRLRLVSLGLLSFALLLIVRLYFVQIVHGEEYALRAEHQYVNASQQLYDRGAIYFTRKDGTLISAATLATGFIVAIDPGKIKDPEKTFAALSAHLTLSREEFMARAAKIDDPYEEVADHVAEEAGTAIDAEDLPGVMVIRERWRFYPAKEKAAQSIGLIGYDDKNTIAGRYGLERYYDYALVRDGEGVFGNFFAELFANIGSVVVDAREARRGDVVTSIEPIVQQKLDEVLRDVQRTYYSQETGGIIMDPKTGAIIALDTIPSFDPNTYTSADPALFNNHIVERRYEFGSIMKALTMASGIDAGVITPETTYNDTGCITLNTKRICNYDLKARGVVPMQEVLSQSLNLGVSWIAGKLGHDRLRTYFTNLGMDTETGVDLPSEIRGTLANLTDRDVNYATASFGQGIAQTPIEMIRALGALANHGSIVTPHLGTAIHLQSGIDRPLSWGPSQKVFSPESTAAVTDMLVTVVDTALAKGKMKIPEMSVAAKTGTAQMASPLGGYYADRYFHSFFGYFPASNPRFIILLYTREPQGVQYASETLTDTFMDLVHFLTNYYDVPPDRATYEKTS
ncbi:MAG: penicillin-binding protein 2 [Minisyncoccia bacterium]